MHHCPYGVMPTTSTTAEVLAELLRGSRRQFAFPSRPVYPRHCFRPQAPAFDLELSAFAAQSAVNAGRLIQAGHRHELRHILALHRPVRRQKNCVRDRLAVLSRAQLSVGHTPKEVCPGAEHGSVYET